VKRFLLVLAGVVLGSATFALGAFVLLWLFSENSLQVDFRNDSGVSLQNVAIIVPGAAFSPAAQDMQPGGGVIFNTGDTLKPRRNLPIHVVFDTDGRHYDVPKELRLAPFGSYYLSVRIRDNLAVSCDAKTL